MTNAWVSVWVDVEGVDDPSDEPATHPFPLETLTVNMSPCFSFILVRKLAASLPNSKAWPSQGMLPRSKGGSPGRLQKPQHLVPCDKARERTESRGHKEVTGGTQQTAGGFPARGTMRAKVLGLYEGLREQYGRRCG